MPEYFAIVGPGDRPLYESELGRGAWTPEQRELNPFVLHSSLDVIEDLQWQLLPENSDTVSNTGGGEFGGAAQSGAAQGGGGGFLRSHRAKTETDNCYLGRVDHFYGLAVSAYTTYSGLKLLMVHGSGIVDDANCRSFYQEVHELYVKTLMNPFYSAGGSANGSGSGTIGPAPITSRAFDSRVKAIARRHLR
ncbi:TRAPP subunit TRS20 KNAG_0L01090 [Huiozyma naganishii CBS 8797]|uniref:Trafficking protein particle complex subunit n=1 Tax=Huiozyma naganishii (strain ATCC MYA-139 / BCRC 22969 / CBS 8797 / KCTC 17520 / NBRC 10181 / NCYC 3082 / Yp74L-3) TaxID=1071383 RepID=J7RCX5_HUIN7|nr:hypothetical protein KNAG_0L01090 [Kazachstania naganishii CBS 8797]CCK72730.1 hypothetical protein KNAG_0L01090 [Kazachstania naganishii CBS 8797]